MEKPHYFSEFFKPKNKTYGDTKAAINKPADSSNLISKTSSEGSLQTAYYQTLQNMFQSYLTSQCAYNTLYNKTLTVDQIAINNSVNETFIGYVNRSMQYAYKTPFVCNAQSFADIATYNCLTNGRINQDELLHDCSTLSTVYEALLATTAERLGNSGEQLNSARLSDLSRMFEKSYNKSPDFFTPNNFYRGEENTGLASVGEVAKLAEQGDEVYLRSLDLIAGASVGFEKVYQQRFGEFCEVAQDNGQGVN